MPSYKAYKIIVIASIPFVLHLGFELFVLTYFYGPQMLLFSFAHGGFGVIWTMVVSTSFMFNAVHFIYTPIAVILSSVGKLQLTRTHRWILGGFTFVQLLLLAALYSYDTWVSTLAGI